MHISNPQVGPTFANEKKMLSIQKHYYNNARLSNYLFQKIKMEKQISFLKTSICQQIKLAEAHEYVETPTINFIKKHYSEKKIKETEGKYCRMYSLGKSSKEKIG